MNLVERQIIDVRFWRLKSILQHKSCKTPNSVAGSGPSKYICIVFLNPKNVVKRRHHSSLTSREYQRDKHLVIWKHDGFLLCQVCEI